MKMMIKIDKSLTIGAIIGWFVVSPLLFPKYFNSINTALIWLVLGIFWSIMLGMFGQSIKDYIKLNRQLTELKIKRKILEKMMRDKND